MEEVKLRAFNLIAKHNNRKNLGNLSSFFGYGLLILLSCMVLKIKFSTNVQTQNDRPQVIRQHIKKPISLKNLPIITRIAPQRLKIVGIVQSSSHTWVLMQHAQEALLHASLGDFVGNYQLKSIRANAIDFIQEDPWKKLTLHIKTPEKEFYND